jgi:hypothetical protein
MWSIQDVWRLFNKMPILENVSLGTCETWAMPKGTGIISTNVQQVLVCRMQLFSKPQEQQFYHQMGKRKVGKHCVCVHPQWQYTH